MAKRKKGDAPAATAPDAVRVDPNVEQFIRDNPRLCRSSDGNLLPDNLIRAEMRARGIEISSPERLERQQIIAWGRRRAASLERRATGLKSETEAARRIFRKARWPTYLVLNWIASRNPDVIERSYRPAILYDHERSHSEQLADREPAHTLLLALKLDEIQAIDRNQSRVNAGMWDDRTIRDLIDDACRGDEFAWRFYREEVLARWPVDTCGPGAETPEAPQAHLEPTPTPKGPTRSAATPSALSTRAKGPKPIVRDKLKKAMRAALDNGTLTPASLSDMQDKVLIGRFGKGAGRDGKCASRSSVRGARDEILKEIEK